jgi:hypothetical protein
MLLEPGKQLPDGRQLSILLDEYARQIERLSPSPRNPERFHEDKSEIVAGLLRLASEVSRGKLAL